MDRFSLNICWVSVFGIIFRNKPFIGGHHADLGGFDKAYRPASAATSISDKSRLNDSGSSRAGVWRSRSDHLEFTMGAVK